MSTIRNRLHSQEYIYDFDVDGGTSATTIELSAKTGKDDIPNGAIVKTVYAKVITACTGGASSTIEWGNADTDGYSGSAIAVANFTDNAIFNGWDNGAALLWDDSNDHPIYYHVSSAASGAFNLLINDDDLTAGKILFNVEYYMPSED